MPRPASAITLEDIAQRAGVSKNTVSVALRNRPGVSDATRLRIRQIAEGMGYRPNPLVAALMHNLRSARPAQSTANLAFLHCYDFGQAIDEFQFLRELYRGVRARCEASGFSVSPVWAREPGLKPERLRDVLVARGIGGVVVAPVPSNRRHLRLAWRDFAAATLGFSLWRPSLHRACSNMMQCLGMAVRELTKLGYQRIGIAYSPESDQRVERSWTAAIAVQRATHARLICTPFCHSHDESALQRWLKVQSPDAVISAGINGLWQKIASLGYDIPGDIGYANVLGDPEDRGKVATVVRHWRELGAAAADLVAGQLVRNERGIPSSRRTVLIDGKWQAGASVRNIRNP